MSHTAAEVRSFIKQNSDFAEIGERMLEEWEKGPRFRYDQFHKNGSTRGSGLDRCTQGGRDLARSAQGEFLARLGISWQERNEDVGWILD